MKLTEKKTLEWAKTQIDAAVAENPDLPVFVSTHHPPKGTLPLSETDGCRNLDDLFSQYPQVVVLCGHTHASTMDETSISQTEYTAINTQCTSYICFENCDLDQEGGAEIEDNPMAMILEIKNNQAVFHRYSVLTGKEQKEPWVLNYPVSNDNFTYTYDDRKKASPAPQWANDFECSWQDVKLNDMNTKEISFTAASHPDGVFITFLNFLIQTEIRLNLMLTGLKKPSFAHQRMLICRRRKEIILLIFRLKLNILKI